MKRLTRIILFAALLLTGCQPSLTPSPTTAPTNTPLPPTATPAPTATATPAPTATATEVPLPTFDAWSEGQLATLDNYQVMEIDGIQTAVTTLADGREIQVLEYVNNEWRPTYNTMDLFAHEDGTFDLEDAWKTQFFRVVEEEKDGEIVRWINEDDYDRFFDKSQELYNAIEDKTKLAWVEDVVSSDPGRVKPTTGTSVTVYYYTYPGGPDRGESQIVAGASCGDIKLTADATLEKMIPYLSVDGVGYSYSFADKSVEETLANIAHQQILHIGEPGQLSLFGITSCELNAELDSLVKMDEEKLRKLCSFTEMYQQYGLNLNKERPTLDRIIEQKLPVVTYESLDFTR